MALDYHIHTPLCGHARGRPEEYLREAVRRGLSEIGFADHAPLPEEARRHVRLSVPFETIAMPWERLASYVRIVERLRRTSPIPVRLGLETDYVPYSRRFVTAVLEHPFDYLIGSVHFVDHWGFDQEEFLFEQERYGFGRLMRRYLELVTEMASTRLFDVAGHLDLPKKFGRKPDRRFDAAFRRALKAVKLAGMAVELNTSGWDRPAAEAYPSEALLRLCHELDIPVTLGSDAHSPEEVGRHLDRGRRLLRKVGYRRLASFRRHVLTAVPL